MSERTCIRECTNAGTHYAQCPDYGRMHSTCPGCAPAVARHGTLVCDRCYGRLYRTLEQAPELIEHLHTIAHTVSAKRYDRVGGHADPSTLAPTSADVLDAIRDITLITNAKTSRTPATTTDLRDAVNAGVSDVLTRFDEIANNADDFAAWWTVVMPDEIPEHPDFWTIARALHRWPIADRRRWAQEPCPACDLKTLKITPPRHPGGRTWYVCESCAWERNDSDDHGTWGDISYDTGIAITYTEEHHGTLDARE